MVVIPHSPYVPEHYVKWMIEHDLEERKILYAKDNTT